MLEWYKKIILEQKREIIKLTIITLFLTIIFSLWYFLSDKTFEWQNYKFISETLFQWRLLSGLVFVSLGRILYELKVYYFLHFIIVRIFKDKGAYKDTKDILWYFLMFMLGFYILPWIIGVINFILSLLYNSWLLILYLLPSVGIFLCIFFIFMIIFRHKKSI